MPGNQRIRMASFLAHQRTGILSTTGSQGVWATPVWYRPDFSSSVDRSLDVMCMVPRWSDIAHHLTLDSRVVFIVQASSEAGLRWLQIQGTAWPVDDPDWSSLLQNR